MLRRMSEKSRDPWEHETETTREHWIADYRYSSLHWVIPGISRVKRLVIVSRRIWRSWPRSDMDVHIPSLLVSL